MHVQKGESDVREWVQGVQGGVDARYTVYDV